MGTYRESDAGPADFDLTQHKEAVATGVVFSPQAGAQRSAIQRSPHILQRSASKGYTSEPGKGWRPGWAGKTCHNVLQARRVCFPCVYTRHAELVKTMPQLDQTLSKPGPSGVSTQSLGRFDYAARGLCITQSCSHRLRPVRTLRPVRPVRSGRRLACCVCALYVCRSRLRLQ